MKTKWRDASRLQLKLTRAAPKPETMFCSDNSTLKHSFVSLNRECCNSHEVYISVSLFQAMPECRLGGPKRNAQQLFMNSFAILLGPPSQCSGLKRARSQKRTLRVNCTDRRREGSEEDGTD